MKGYTIIALLSLGGVHGFWDMATTTEDRDYTDTKGRTSFFRWQQTEPDKFRYYFPWWDMLDLDYRRKLNVVAGISIDFLPLGVAAILNARTLLTSANYLEPYRTRQREVRIWALGRAGKFNTPYRYRVWRIRRIFPKSNNPEHWHGARARHSPRHDLVIIHTMDKMYVAASPPTEGHIAYRIFLCDKRYKLTDEKDMILFAGSGFESIRHVQENYKIYFGLLSVDRVVNCEHYLPKWWGKFICFVNNKGYAGVPSGGPLFTFSEKLVGIGSFEIRYNDDRIMVFTDLRYYVDHIQMLANITAGDYYEYAYPQWSIRYNHGWFWPWDTYHNDPYIPIFHIHTNDRLYPIGKK